jgi:aminoglycoside phosphotransferase (APT) family kinase protein
VRSAPRHPRESLVASICARVLAETPTSIRPIVGNGVVNAVFAVETRSRSLVFRIQLDDPATGAFRKERWCMARASEAGVPGAEVVALGADGPHAYSIHTRLPGVVGTDYGGDLDRVWCELGRLTHRFHPVEVLGFGEHLGGPVGESPDTTLAAWVDAWVERALDNSLLVEAGVLSRPALDEARAIVSRIREWSGTPRLCHGNLSLSNVLVDGDDVFVIDWGTAAGHLAPHFDLAELRAWSTKPARAALDAFLSGYGLPVREYEALAESLAALQLWRVLTGAHWMLETGRATAATRAFAAEKVRRLLERTE